MSGGFIIDSSKISLEAVLLHNGSKYASVPVGHSVRMEDSYDNLTLVLTMLNCKDHGWMNAFKEVIAKFLGNYKDNN
jgi:hypothetical protein